MAYRPQSATSPDGYIARHFTPVRAFVIAMLAALALLFTMTGREAAAQTGPLGTSGDFLASQGFAPPGANDPNCRPDADHPPIVLVHATYANMYINFFKLSPALREQGYCVYALNYGDNVGPLYALGDIRQSARELDRFVDNVRAYTGEDKVSIVGHSQGGMMPRYYIKNLGGAEKVEDLVGIVPSNHGTTVPQRLGPGIPLSVTINGNPLGICGAACDQQQAGSSFLRNLNSGDETPGNVNYTVVATRTDETVVPYTSSFLAGSPEQVTNITLQDYYPMDSSGHTKTIFDPNVYTFIFDALERSGPADP